MALTLHGVHGSEAKYSAAIRTSSSVAALATSTMRLWDRGAQNWLRAPLLKFGHLQTVCGGKARTPTFSGRVAIGVVGTGTDYTGWGCPTDC